MAVNDEQCINTEQFYFGTSLEEENSYIDNSELAENLGNDTEPARDVTFEHS